jgi:hypothetical protein
LKLSWRMGECLWWLRSYPQVGCFLNLYLMHHGVHASPVIPLAVPHDGQLWASAEQWACPLVLKKWDWVHFLVVRWVLVVLGVKGESFQVGVSQDLRFLMFLLYSPVLQWISLLNGCIGPFGQRFQVLRLWQRLVGSGKLEGCRCGFLLHGLFGFGSSPFLGFRSQGFCIVSSICDLGQGSNQETVLAWTRGNECVVVSLGRVCSEQVPRKGKLSLRK